MYMREAMQQEFTLKDAERLLRNARKLRTERGLKGALSKYTLEELQAACRHLYIYPIGTRSMCATTIKNKIGKWYPEQKERWMNKLYRKKEEAKNVVTSQ